MKSTAIVFDRPKQLSLKALELPEVKGSVTLGDRWRVVPDDAFLQRLRETFGAENISLSYAFGP